jgi:hypothetical protein
MTTTKSILPLMVTQVGGLDIFVSKINADGTFGKVQNVGMDANSLRMILGIGLILNPEEVFSSNRDGGQGYDDL